MNKYSCLQNKNENHYQKTLRVNNFVFGICTNVAHCSWPADPIKLIISFSDIRC